MFDMYGLHGTAEVNHGKGQAFYQPAWGRCDKYAEVHHQVLGPAVSTCIQWLLSKFGWQEQQAQVIRQLNIGAAVEGAAADAAWQFWADQGESCSRAGLRAVHAPDSQQVSPATYRLVTETVQSCRCQSHAAAVDLRADAKAPHHISE